MNAIISSNASTETESIEQLPLGPTLRFDANHGQFVGEQADAANQLLRREYRVPFIVPEV